MHKIALKFRSNWCIYYISADRNVSAHVTKCLTFSKDNHISLHKLYKPWWIAHMLLVEIHWLNLFKTSNMLSRRKMKFFQRGQSSTPKNGRRKRCQKASIEKIYIVKYLTIKYLNSRFSRREGRTLCLRSCTTNS